MRNSKLFLAAFASAATIGLAAPAAASAFNDSATFSAVTLFGYDYTTYTQQVQLTGTVINTPSPGPYIGAFIDDLSTGAGQLAFCDDLGNVIDPNGVPYNYFASDLNNTVGAVDYLSPLSQNTINDIVGLVYEATINPSLTAQQGAAYQLAIWDLEYGAANIAATSISDPSVQADANNLLGVGNANADADYAAFFADGTYSFVQIELPINCDTGADNPSLVGQISYQATPYPGSVNCQIQGQILVVPNGHTQNVPEPGTLALLGSGLIGLGAYRRRRRKTA